MPQRRMNQRARPPSSTGRYLHDASHSRPATGSQDILPGPSRLWGLKAQRASSGQFHSTHIGWESVLRMRMEGDRTTASWCCRRSEARGRALLDSLFLVTIPKDKWQHARVPAEKSQRGQSPAPGRPAEERRSWVCIRATVTLQKPFPVSLPPKAKCPLSSFLVPVNQHSTFFLYEYDHSLHVNGIIEHLLFLVTLLLTTVCTRSFAL